MSRISTGRMMAAGVLVASSLLVLSASAEAKSSPRIAVNPGAGLHNGQTVKVHGSGFTPGDSVYIVECQANASGQSNCDIATATPATITAGGLLPVTKFVVVTGKVGQATCGTTAKNARGCDISVGNVSGGDSTFHRISFKVAHSKNAHPAKTTHRGSSSTRGQG